MLLVFSDLDGTLLERETYSFQAARPALERLRRHGVPLVLVSSKTRAEMEVWRRRLGTADPFIVENGGGIFIPAGYFPFRPAGAVRRDDYDVLELGDSYANLVEALRQAADECGCRVRGVHQMSADEISAWCGMPAEEAALAMRREFDEPFRVLDAEREAALLAAIERRGKRWTRGDRFHHILGPNDKGAALGRLRELYERAHGTVTTAGLGDAPNDASFLNLVDRPILVRSPFAGPLQRAVPRGRLTALPGPAGWNQAVLEMLPE